MATIVQKYNAMESAWEDQAACWEPSVPTQPLVQAKRAHPRDTPGPIAKKYKPITRRGTVLEGWLDGPCKIHTTPDTIPTHSLRACWILRQVAKSGEDILTKNTQEQHPPEDDDPRVLTVFETFTSNSKRKRALRDLAEVCQIAAINTWNDTTITFNAGDEPKYKTVRAPAALVLSPIVDNFRLTKVLMDGGSGLNLIYEDTLHKMEIDRSRIEQSSTTFKESFSGGRRSAWEK